MVWCRDSCCLLNPGACLLADDADDATRPEFPVIGHRRVRWADPPFGRSCLCLDPSRAAVHRHQLAVRQQRCRIVDTKDGGNTKLSGQDPGM